MYLVFNSCHDIVRFLCFFFLFHSFFRGQILSFFSFYSILFFSQSGKECLLGHEEPSSSKHHNFGVGEQFCFCLQQGQSKPSIQHVCSQLYWIKKLFLYIDYLFVPVSCFSCVYIILSLLTKASILRYEEKVL